MLRVSQYRPCAFGWCQRTIVSYLLIIIRHMDDTHITSDTMTLVETQLKLQLPARHFLPAMGITEYARRALAAGYLDDAELAAEIMGHSCMMRVACAAVDERSDRPRVRDLREVVSDGQSTQTAALFISSEDESVIVAQLTRHFHDLEAGDIADIVLGARGYQMCELATSIVDAYSDRMGRRCQRDVAAAICDRRARMLADKPGWFGAAALNALAGCSIEPTTAFAVTRAVMDMCEVYRTHVEYDGVSPWALDRYVADARGGCALARGMWVWARGHEERVEEAGPDGLHRLRWLVGWYGAHMRLKMALWPFVWVIKERACRSLDSPVGGRRFRRVHGGELPSVHE